MDEETTRIFRRIPLLYEITMFIHFFHSSTSIFYSSVIAQFLFSPFFTHIFREKKRAQWHFGKLIHEENARHCSAYGHPFDDAEGLEAREPHGDLRR
jgi:hypothetical protein